MYVLISKEYKFQCILKASHRERVSPLCFFIMIELFDFKYCSPRRTCTFFFTKVMFKNGKGGQLHKLACDEMI